MKRVYNHKLSPEINAQLNRRVRTVAFQRRVIFFLFVMIVSILILLGSTINAFAGTKFAPLPVQKYYTSYQVQSGDTVWSIAEHFTENTDILMEDYIEEVCSMNDLTCGKIHSGQHLVVAYYSADIQ